MKSLRASSKRKLKQAAEAGASGLWGVVLTLLKIIGTVLLIGVTTGVIFACIFVIYIKTNLMKSADLNVTLEDVTLKQTSVVYYTDQNGNAQELCRLEGEKDRTWISYDQIPKDMEHAIVSIEDKRFYKHHGVDWYRTAGAFVNMFLGMKDTFGGSTITQQLIKNVTGDNDPTVKRKLTEIFRALEFEKKYDKKQIIEWYLNVVYFGHKCYGVQSASQYYFGKDVSDLSLAEMCSLAGITNNPSLYDPFTNPENNKSRQENILSAMKEQGYISQAQYDEAVAEKLVFSQASTSSSGSTQVYTYFEDALIEDVISFLQAKRGVSYTVAESLLFNGGYQIYSTLDPSVQAKVDSVYQDLSNIPETSGSDQQLLSSIVITDPYSGNIVALEGGVGQKTQSRIFNLATQAHRPPGSSIKPIAVYAPAMDLGLITPNTKFADSPDIVLKGTDWYPHNDNGSYSDTVMDIRYAIVHSVNTVSAQVLDQLTPRVSYAFLTGKLGVTSLVPDDESYAPLSLGQLTNGITVREMATAYSIFPNSGMFTSSRTFTRICDADGKELYTNDADSHAAISEVTAYWMTNILSEAATSGTGYEAHLDNMPTAGKTGTTSDKFDRWFCGFTPYYVAAVWTGYDTPEKITMVNGGNPASQLWYKVMSLVHEGLEAKDFKTPDNTYQNEVPGVADEVAYRIRGVTVGADGAVTILYDEEAGKLIAGRNAVCNAKEIEGYTVEGDAQITITLTDDVETNVAEFKYVPTAPASSSEPSSGLSSEPSSGASSGPSSGASSEPSSGASSGSSSGTSSEASSGTSSGSSSHTPGSSASSSESGGT